MQLTKLELDQQLANCERLVTAISSDGTTIVVAPKFQHGKPSGANSHVRIFKILDDKIISLDYHIGIMCDSSYHAAIAMNSTGDKIIINDCYNTIICLELTQEEDGWVISKESAISNMRRKQSHQRVVRCKFLLSEDGNRIVAVDELLDINDPNKKLDIAISCLEIDRNTGFDKWAGDWTRVVSIEQLSDHNGEYFLENIEDIRDLRFYNSNVAPEVTDQRILLTIDTQDEIEYNTVLIDLRNGDCTIFDQRVDVTEIVQTIPKDVLIVDDIKSTLQFAYPYADDKTTVVGFKCNNKGNEYFVYKTDLLVVREVNSQYSQVIPISLANIEDLPNPLLAISQDANVVVQGMVHDFGDLGELCVTPLGVITTKNDAGKWEERDIVILEPAPFNYSAGVQLSDSGKVVLVNCCINAAAAEEARNRVYVVTKF